MDISRILLAWCLAGLATASAHAQSPVADDWRFQVILYGYFPSIDGTTTFPTTGVGTGITIDDSTILEHLQGVFMAMGEVSKGRWGAYTDVMYMDLGASKSASRDFSITGFDIPADASANLDYNLRGWVWTIAGTYQAVGDPRGVVQVVAGARLLDIDQKLDYAFTGNFGPIPLPGRQGNLDAKLSNWDAIVGVKGRVTFGRDREWFVPYYIDVGTGQSQLTWQGIAGLGYSFKWGDVIAAWRYLDYDMKSGSKIESLSFNGPAIGVSFRW